MNLLEIIKKIQHEAVAPTCFSYEYDPTPTAEERLQNINKLCELALTQLRCVHCNADFIPENGKKFSSALVEYTCPHCQNVDMYSIDLKCRIPMP